MKKLIFTFFFLITISGFSQEELMSNYELAAKFSPTKLSKLVHSTSVNPHWLRADHFSKHLLGFENNEVDIKMINKDIPKNK